MRSQNTSHRTGATDGRPLGLSAQTLLGSRAKAATAPAREVAGFTLLELLVVIVIVAVLLGMLIPVIQAMREVSRRSTCQHNLMNLHVALAAYHNRQTYYPAGTVNPTGPILSQPQGYHHNWIGALLPHWDAAIVTEPINTDRSVYAPENEAIRALHLPPLVCPSATGISRNTTCYAGIHHSAEDPIDEDNHGVFILNRPTREQDIPDGLSHTLFVGEKLSAPEYDLGWISGTRSSLRNTGHAINSPDGNLPLLPRIRPPVAGDAPGDRIAEQQDPMLPLFVGGLQSHHRGGVYTLSGGGEVVFRADSTDLRLLSQMANKASSEAAVDQDLPVDPAAEDAVGEPALDNDS